MFPLHALPARVLLAAAGFAAVAVTATACGSGHPAAPAAAKTSASAHPLSAQAQACAALTAWASGDGGAYFAAVAADDSALGDALQDSVAAAALPAATLAQDAASAAGNPPPVDPGTYQTLMASENLSANDILNQDLGSATPQMAVLEASMKAWLGAVTSATGSCAPRFTSPAA